MPSATSTAWKEDHPSAPGAYEHGTPEVSGVCGGVKVSGVCGGVKVTDGFKVTRSRVWSGDEIASRQNVHALSSGKAADLVARVRDASYTCEKYVGREGMPKRAVTADLVVSRPAGVDDFYAYCETLDEFTPGLQSCQAYLAHDNLLVVVSANSGGPDFNQVRLTAWKRLKEITPVVAAAVTA